MAKTAAKTETAAVETTEAPAPVKKGKPSWKPAARLPVRNAPEGYRLRWVHKEPANLARKAAEDWIPATSINGFKAEHIAPELVQDGKSLTSAVEYRDLVLMALPEERAQERDGYYAEQTRKQTVGLKKQVEKENADQAARLGATPSPVRGSIVIE